MSVTWKDTVLKLSLMVRMLNCTVPSERTRRGSLKIRSLSFFLKSFNHYSIYFKNRLNYNYSNVIFTLMRICFLFSEIKGDPSICAILNI